MKHKHVSQCCTIAIAGGSNTLEREWLRQRLLGFTVKIAGKKKPRFQYKLPLIGDVCRGAWILAAGFPHKLNSRIATLEAEIRNPALRAARAHRTSLPKAASGTLTLTRTQFAVAFIEEYILQHSQRSPSATNL